MNRFKRLKIADALAAASGWTLASFFCFWVPRKCFVLNSKFPRLVVSLAPYRLATKTVFTFVFFLIVLQTINIVLVCRWQYILYIFLFLFSGKEQRNTKLQQPGKNTLHEDLSWTSSLQALQVTFKQWRWDHGLLFHFAFSLWTSCGSYPCVNKPRIQS